MRLYQNEADTQGIASVLRKQAVAVERIGDFRKLRAIATTSLEHCRAFGDDLGIADASYYLGHSLLMLDGPGNADDALTILRESLEIRRAHGDDVGVVKCLERVGTIHRLKGQSREALSTWDEAMALASQSGDRLGQANTLHMVGVTQVELSDFVKAAEALSEAITITRDVGWDGELSINLRAMGCLKLRLGEYGEAEKLLKESVSIARLIEAQDSLARTLKALGECFQGLSKLREATSAWEESCLLFKELSHHEQWKSVATLLVQLKRSQRDWESALYWHDCIIDMCRSQNDHGGVVSELALKGKTLAEARRYDEAALNSIAAIAICREHGYPWIEKPQ